MAKKLKQMRIDAVGVVEAGANPEAMIVIAKRNNAPDPSQPETVAEIRKRDLQEERRVAALLGQASSSPSDRGSAENFDKAVRGEATMVGLTKDLAEAEADEATWVGAMERVEKRIAAAHETWTKFQVWDVARKDREYLRAYEKQVAASGMVRKLQQETSQPAGTSPPLPRLADVIAKCRQFWDLEVAAHGLPDNPGALIRKVFATRIDEVGLQLDPNAYDRADWRRLDLGSLYSLCQQNEA